jgi:hypothetical protein
MSIKLNVALAVAAASCMTVGLGAASASAGVTPSPSPSFTHTFTPPPRPVPQTCNQRPITFTPTDTPTDQGSPIALSAWHGNTPTPEPTRPVVNPLRCSPEQFVLQQTTVGNVVTQNRVIANGPVFGTGSDDLGVQTNTFSRFSLPGLLRRVNVPHTGIAFPSVNLALCVASVNQLGVWRFAGGPVGSLFRNSIGNGTYLLTGQWVFPTIRGVCSLRLIRGNPILQNRIQPRYSNIQVWATGLARR